MIRLAVFEGSGSHLRYPSDLCLLKEACAYRLSWQLCLLLSIHVVKSCLKIVSSLWGLYMKALDNKQDSSRQQMVDFKWSDIMCFYYIYFF